MKRTLKPWIAFVLLAGSACVAPQAERTTAPDPGEDFFLHVNQDWMGANPIPAAYGSWGVFHEISERNKVVLREILESAAEQRLTADGLTEQLGTFWASGMDAATAEARGIESIRPYLDHIAAVDGREALAQVVGELQMINVGVLFGLGAEADFENSTQTITFIMPGGLGLPEKDYYFREDEESARLRAQYLAHMATMFTLAGDSATDAAASAQRVYDLELLMATDTLGALEYRNPQTLSNKIPTAEMTDDIMPTFAWDHYFQAMGIPKQPVVNLVGPSYFRALDALLKEQDLRTWRDYLRWHLITRSAPYLNEALVAEDFDFYSRKLSGTQENRARWERVLSSANGAMGDALGQAFVAETFSPEAKQVAKTMVADLLDAFRTRLQALPWMTDATKVRALEKLDSFTVKIGYPDKWRDYSGLQMDGDTWIENIFAASIFNNRFQVAKIGKPVDKTEWGMSPQTVNAYYNPLANEIVFPAAILQPPFFGLEQSLAQNYGSMGAIIGHEVTHGFDDMGSQFDAAGNLSDWWTEADRKEFNARTAVLVAQFNAYVAIDDLHVNGELTLGENIADLGGLQMAHLALHNRMEKNGSEAAITDSLDREFFRSWARSWRENTRPESLKLQVNTDPHSPNRFRANGPLGNLPMFAEAFHLDESSTMVREASDRAEIW
ncbi:MAG: M13 family metallopeptidase [Planctomycetota bacterium]|jgi:predicted metalloendopeptidase